MKWKVFPVPLGRSGWHPDVFAGFREQCHTFTRVFSLLGNSRTMGFCTLLRIFCKSDYANLHKEPIYGYRYSKMVQQHQGLRIRYI